MTFKGFPPGKQPLVPLPAQFFTELLPEMDNLDELRVVLYAFWALSQQENEPRWLERSDFAEDERLMSGLSPQRLGDALERAVLRGVLLRSAPVEGREVQYFLNSDRGRQALQALEAGKWPSGGMPRPAARLDQERPNIFRLYERNIGALTPLLAETLREAETSYPADWIEEAFQAAVERNARNWKYIEAILKRWKEEGRGSRDERDSAQSRRKYIQGRYSDFVER